VSKIILANTGDIKGAKNLLSDPKHDVVIMTERRFVEDYPVGTRIAVVTSLNDPYRAAEEAQASVDLTDREYIVSLSERSALAAATLRSFLHLPGETFDAVIRYTNKYVMKRAFRAAGLATANFRLASNEDQAYAAINSIGIAAILKPVMGAGADAMFSTEDVSTVGLSEYLSRIANPATTSEKTYPLLVEQRLDVLNEYHCDGFVQDGTVVYSRVSQYLRPVLAYGDRAFGSFTLDHSGPLAEQITTMHQKAAVAVGITNGPTHFEVLETADGLFAGEIAGRPGGGGIRPMLKKRDGFDSKEARLDSSLMQPYEWQPTQSSAEVGQVMLPAKRGTIRKISTREDLLAIPGVVSAELDYSAGDVVGGLMDSSSVSGLVLIDLDDGRTPHEMVDVIESVFTLEVE